MQTQEEIKTLKKAGRPLGSKDKKKRKRRSDLKKKPKKKPKRIRCFGYDEARLILSKENLTSVGMYEKWWALHTPSRLPKRPDRAYKKVWKGWGHFLGYYNPFPGERKKYASYQDAKTYAHRFNLKNKDEWFTLCREQGKPNYIPNRPDVVYRTRKEWMGWKDFLGSSFIAKLDNVKSKNGYLYIAVEKTMPNNIYYIKKTTEHPGGFKRFCIENSLKIGIIYQIPEFETESTYKNIISKYTIDYSYRYGDNFYLVPNINELTSELSNIYRRFIDPY